jgi:hypothetical protein
MGTHKSFLPINKVLFFVNEVEFEFLALSTCFGYVATNFYPLIRCLFPASGVSFSYLSLACPINIGFFLQILYFENLTLFMIICENSIIITFFLLWRDNSKPRYLCVSILNNSGEEGVVHPKFSFVQPSQFFWKHWALLKIEVGLKVGGW